MSLLEAMAHDLDLSMDDPGGDSVLLVILPHDDEDKRFAVMGKFEAAYQPVAPAGVHAPVMSTQPTAWLRESQAAGLLGRALSRMDKLEIGGVLYRPEEIRPDGFNLLTVRLQEA